MRVPLIAGNWKLFKTIPEAVAFINDLKPLVKDVAGVEIVVSPVFTALNSVCGAVEGSRINVSAQDCYWEKEGAFTGEVSSELLKDAGCTHVIIGHSERRQYFGETDETVNKKVKSAIATGLTVLMCVGESLAERESGLTFKVIEKQVRHGLSGIDAEGIKNIVVAYEPVWAIGTGKTATDDQAQEVHAFIRKQIAGLYSQKEAGAIRILYGGSVKPDNISGLMACSDIDGALVGGASLKAESFAAIIKFEG